MSAAKKIGKKISKWTITGLLTTGVIISIGLLSFCGMMEIAPIAALGWVFFALAGFVDGEVYKQNIADGIDDLKLLGKKGLEILLIKALDKKVKLDKKLKKESNEKMELFEREYKAQKEYVENFEHKKLTREQKEERERAIQRLRRMQKYFVKQVLSTNDTELFIKSFRSELPSLKRKIWFLRFSAPFSLIAGIGFGFATAAALDTALVTISAALSVVIWPLAIVACIGYAFLIYHTLADMITNETVTKWRKKIAEWFKRNENEKEPNLKNNAKYGLRIISRALLLTLVVGIGILATLATAGTWWIAVKNGAAILTGLAAVARHIRNILVPIAAFTMLIFTIDNSFKSVKNIIKDLQNFHPIEYFKTKMDIRKNETVLDFLKRRKEEIFPGETILQILNPFRILIKCISLPFNLLVFVGHLIAVGLVGDRAPGLNSGATIASAAVGAVSDGLVDYHYVKPMDNTKKKPENCNGESESLVHHDHKDHDHKGHDHKGHHHNLISDWILRIVLSPLHLLSASWDFVTSKAYKKPDASQQFKACLKKSFGFHDHPAYDEVKAARKSETSTEWIKQEIELRFEKHEKKASVEDKAALVEYKKDVLERATKPDSHVSLRIFKHKATKEFSQKVWEDYCTPQKCMA